MTQNLSTTTQSETTQTRQPNSDDEITQSQLDEIIVTGSQIRGAESASPLVVIDRDTIARSGYATTQRVLQSIPQNFSGGPNIDTQTTGIEGTANIANGSGVNLRGLGAGSTLVLVNGRRQAPSGLLGGFVDVSSIPVTAIERIEVLADGASAVYGSDAVGGVVNIILRKDFEGIEAQARFAPDTGNDYDETQVSIAGGTSWSSGNVMASYELNNSSSLANLDRPYLASADLTPFGGDDFRSDRSQPGNVFSLGTGEILAIPAGQDGTMLTAADLLAGAPNLSSNGATSDILPDQEQHSIYVSSRQEIGNKVELFAEARYRTRETDQLAPPATAQFMFVPTSNAFIDDAFDEAVNGFPASFVLVHYSFIDDLGLVTIDTESKTVDALVGASVDIGSDWLLEMYGSVSNEQSEVTTRNQVSFAALDAALADSDPNTAFNPFGDGSNTNPSTVESIRRSFQDDIEAEVRTINIRADGPLLALSGGDVKLAMGLDYREEEFDKRFVSSDNGLGTVTDLERDVSAMFAELFIPFVSQGNATRFARRLEISLAARYDDYSDFGSTTNPKFGLLWSPTDSITFKSSYGTSFKTPRLVDLDPVEQAAIRRLDDPDSSTGRTNTLVRTGTNPSLTEETSDTWSLGLVIRPISFEQFSFSLNYFDIQYDNRIAAPDSFRNIHQPRFEGAVTFDFTQADLDAICLGPDFIGDPGPCTVDLVEAIGDARLRNTAVTEITGFDTSIAYDIENDNGLWSFGIDATVFEKYEEAFSTTAPVFEIADTIGNPISLQARARASWTHSHFGADLFVNYTDNYVDNVSIPERKIDSYTTVDMQLSYHPDDSWLLSLSVLNLFDEDPPFANTPFGGYDRANADPLRRLVALQARKVW